MFKIALCGKLVGRRFGPKLYKQAYSTADAMLDSMPGPGTCLPHWQPATHYVEHVRARLTVQLERCTQVVLDQILHDSVVNEGSIPPKLFHYTSVTAAKSIIADGILHAGHDEDLVFGPGVYMTDQGPPSVGPQVVEQNTQIGDASFVFEFDSQALQNQTYHVKDVHFNGYSGHGGFYTILHDRTQRIGSVSIELGGLLPYSAFRWVDAHGWEQVHWHASTGDFRPVSDV